MIFSQAYHFVNNLVHLSHGELQHQIDCFVLVILILYSLHQILRLGPVTSLLHTALPGDGVVLLHNPQTHNLVAIVHQLVNQPLKRVFRVVVVVTAAQKGP